MFVRTSARLAALTVAALAATAAPARANLITNGGFETPGFAGFPDYRYLPNGDTSITGWTVTSDGIGEEAFWAKAPSYTVLDGSYAVFLNQGSTIETTFAVTAGTTYTLTFGYFAGAPGNQADYLPLGVEVAGFGTTFTDATFNSSYNTGTYQFTALVSNPAAVLRFSNPAGNPADPGVFAAYNIDAVSIVPAAVPEPGSLALAGVALAGAGLRAARRRRAG